MVGTVNTVKKRPFLGKHEGAELKPKVQAIYAAVKSWPRALKLAETFWPEDLEWPLKETQKEWRRQVELGVAQIDNGIAEWCRGMIETERQQALHMAGVDAATTFSHFARRMREYNELPPGGVVGLKYLADAAGFMLGKHAEITGHKGAQQTLSIGQLSIVAAAPRRQRQITGVREVSELQIASEARAEGDDEA